MGLYAKQSWYKRINYNDFIVEKRLHPLPGKDAHIRLAPVQRLADMFSDPVPPEGARESAVLVLLIPTGPSTAPEEIMEWSVLLIKRNSYAGVHSAQIAFPGGKREPEDKSFMETAYREAFEEMGIERDKTVPISALSGLYVPPSNFYICPVLAIAREELRFTVDPREVTGYREIKIKEFNPDKTELRKFQSPTGEWLDAPGYSIEDYFIWGATAMILSELYQVVADATLSKSLSSTYISSSNPSI